MTRNIGGPARVAGTSRPIAGQLTRFALVGLVNTAAYYGSYLLLRTAVPYLVAHVVAFLLSMCGPFVLNCYFTYRTPPTWRKFALFPLTVAGSFMVTTVGVVLLVEGAHTDQRWAPLVAALAAIPVTFLATRRVLAGSPVRG